MRLGLICATLCLTSGAGLADPVLPPAGGGYDSQLGGAYPPPPGTRIVSRDREAAPAPGLYNICYVNLFQTQPGESASWLEQHPDLLLHRDGKPVEDPNWPGEYLLDTRTPERRAALIDLVRPWIEGCAKAGYDAIEADNLDTFSRSGGALTLADNLAYAKLFNAEARRLGLASGQKNGVEMGAQGQAAGFDFAITESCQVYDECDGYAQVYGRHVLEIEYTDTPRAAFDAACAARGDTGSVVLRDRQLAPKGAAGHHFEICATSR